MRVKILLLLILLHCFLLAERSVTLQEVIDAALKNNDELASAGYELQSSSWAKYSALSSFLPSASLSYTRLRLDPAPEYVDFMGNSSSLDDEQTTASLQIVQPVFTGGKRLLGYLIAGKLENIAENQYNSTHLETRNSAELKYLSLLESWKLKQIAEDDLKTIQNNLDITQVKYDTGVTSEAELLQMQSELAAKEAASIDAEMYYQISAADLANFCGYEDQILIPDENPKEIILNSVLDTIKPELVSAKLIELCFSRNLTLSTLNESVKLSKLNKVMALSDNFPSLSLIYEKSWDDDFDFDDDKDESSSLMLTASLPLLPFVDTFCNYKKEHYQLKKTQRELSSAKKGMRLQINSTILSLVSSVKKLKSSELALQYANRTLTQMEERYRNNLTSSTELLSVSLLKQSSQIAVLRNKIDLIRYKSDLKKLLNITTDDELMQIIINT